MKNAATAAVLPAGSLPVVAIDKQATYTLKINRVATELLETPESEVIYPDGFIKWHQASSIAALLEKVTGTLRGRYGIEKFDFSGFPKELGEGEVVITSVVFAE